MAFRHAASVRARPRGGGSGQMLGVLAVLAGLTLSLTVAGTAVLGTVGIGAYTAVESALPDPKLLETIRFAEPTIIYDRTGKLELARFQQERRRVVPYEEIPRLVLDAVVVTEDQTFWTNEGFESSAIVAAIFETLQGDRARGASTITQQLVRALLLPKELTQPGANIYERKVKEVIQARRLTEAYPGEAGKRRIIAAYLNHVYFGHGAYGIAAAADVFFGVSDLSKLTPAQAALLAGLIKSPTAFDPYKDARKDAQGRLLVRANSRSVLRRNYILNNLRAGRWTRLTQGQIRKAKTEPVILVGDRPNVFQAPHFSWQVRRQLQDLLGDSDPVETGGYRVVTTIDMRAQAVAERYITAAAIVPNLPAAERDRAIREMNLGRDEEWVRNLVGRDLHNAAMSVIDYRRGEVLAYVGSAGYYRAEMRKPQFDPQYDVAGDGYRQPGSAWKPLVFATGFEERLLTPGSLIMDATTEFRADDPQTPSNEQWVPRNANRREYGPVLARKALQYSLNIPTIKAMARVGTQAVARRAELLGIRTQRPGLIHEAGLAGALGTIEVRNIDLTSAFGALANGGVHVPARFIQEVRRSDGSLVWKNDASNAQQAFSPGAAYLISDVLAGNTDPVENLVWGELFPLLNGPSGERRPAAMKTGTTNDTRDLATYGYLAPPADPVAPGLAVGVWMGNSDHSQPNRTTDDATFASAGPARIWHAFLRDYTAGQPIADFQPPPDVVEVPVDAFSGGKPGAWTQEETPEWFIAGTEPGSSGAIDPAGLLYREDCDTWWVDPVQAETGPQPWRDAVADWTERALRGTRVEGEHDTRTSYFYDRESWGGEIMPSTGCVPEVPWWWTPPPEPSFVFPTPLPEPTVEP